MASIGSESKKDRNCMRRYRALFLLLWLVLCTTSLQEGLFAASIANCEPALRLNINLFVADRDCWQTSQNATSAGDQTLFEQVRSFEVGDLAPNVDAELLQIELQAELHGVEAELVSLAASGAVLDRATIGALETSQIKLHKRMEQFSDAIGVAAASEERVELAPRQHSLIRELPAGTRRLEVRLRSHTPSVEALLQQAELELSQAQQYSTFLPTVRTPIRHVDGKLTPLLSLAYYLERDSSGTKPATNTDITFTLGPDGKAQLYASQELDGLGYLGTYSYGQGQLNVQFEHPDFVRKGQVTLDPSQATVTLPFQVFSDDPGSSTWKRHEVDVVHNIRQVFYGLIMAGASEDEALARAYDYAQAMVSVARQSSKLELAQLAPELVKAEQSSTGIELIYSYPKGLFDTPAFLPLDVQLIGWADPALGQKLNTSPLASDPRVHLDPLPPTNSEADPSNKSALFISPFHGERLFQWSANRGVVTASFGEWSKLDSKKQLLEAKGYSVKTLIDEEASVVNIIRALKTSPGFINFHTHGFGEGVLSTGTYLGRTVEEAQSLLQERVAKELRDANFGSVLTCAYAPQACAIGTANVSRSMRPNAQAHFVTVNPGFWSWMGANGADFTQSLVLITACSTDETPHLREAIQSRAYFAMNVVSTSKVSGALIDYFVQTLGRRTRSAEEVYYNIMRVTRTGLKIYKEDNLLDGATTWSYRGQNFSLSANFNGYFYPGPEGEVHPYRTAGWLGSAQIADPGVIWWLLASARWSQNTETGVKNLRRCWDEYWSSGRKAPALGDPDCHNREVGSSPPKAAEVGYALYLYSGKDLLSFEGVLVERWTLNEGRR